MLCVKCKKRTAVVFIQRMEDGQPKQEGYCLTCAWALGIKPVISDWKLDLEFVFVSADKPANVKTTAQ